MTTLPNPLPGEPPVQLEGLGLDHEDFRPAWLELKDRGDKRFVSIKRASAAAVSTRP